MGSRYRKTRRPRRGCTCLNAGARSIYAMVPEFMSDGDVEAATCASLFPRLLIDVTT